MIQKWLKSTLSELVSEPDDIIITEVTDEMGVLFTISTPHKSDLGTLIGRKGEHVNALRILLRIYGHRQGVKASLKIITD